MRRLIERYRLPEYLADARSTVSPDGETGFFRFGEDGICYGACPGLPLVHSLGGNLPRVEPASCINQRGLHFPFAPDEIIDNLLLERYVSKERAPLQEIVRDLYYKIRPLLGVAVREHLQRIYLQGWKRIPFPAWPVDSTVDDLLERFLILTMQAQGLKSVPFIWFWPNDASTCAIVTHDVETEAGRDFCSKLMSIDESWGMRASFQVVPEQRYEVPAAFLEEIRARGFEVNVHDLNHDGQLFWDRRAFTERVSAINQYGKEFKAVGFRSGGMYRNQDWLRELEFEYDMSVPNVAHLEPQRGGCCTVMPYFNGDLVELPLTVTQDYALFHFMNTRSMDLWKEQIDVILKRNGLITILAHPDYIMCHREESLFQSLLSWVAELRDTQETWTATPREVNQWWRERNSLKLVKVGNEWTIEGKGSERASVAYAELDGERVSYRREKMQSTVNEVQ